LTNLPNRPDIIWSDREDLGRFLPDGWRENIAELRKTVPKPAPPPPPRQPRGSIVLYSVGVRGDDREALEDHNYGNGGACSPCAYKSPRLIKTGAGALEDLGIASGRITLLAAPPKRFKTTLAMQLGVDAARIDSRITTFVCNVEMQPEILM